ncbi:MAG: SLC13 family permease, partial [Candidatus Brocadiales bacterium]
TCEILGLNPIPMLMGTVLLSGIGGVATLVGDPPNMMIGSAAGITFNEFLFHLGLPVVAAWAVTLLTLRVVMRKEIAIKPKNIEALLEMDEGAAIHDHHGLRKTLIALGLVLLLFFFQGKLGLLPSSISILGLAIAFLWVRPNPDDILKEVDWSILLFFISLFVAVGGVEKAGILDMVAEKIAAHAHTSLMFTCALLFWVAAISSAIVDNIPFTMAMIPVIQYLGTQGIDPMPLWWALAMGVGFGGNGTPIGAAPNIITVSISEKTKYPITLGVWLRSGTAVMVVTCLTCISIELLFFGFFKGH